MTLEEKANRIETYCNARVCTADGYTCPLFGRKTCWGYCDPEEKVCVAENYEILFGGSEKVDCESVNKTEPVNITLHAAICDELKDLYRRKNADYGDSFHKTFIEEGMAMARIRLSDKMERFKRLTRSGEQNVKDESVRDTLIDLANYAIMTIVEMEREKE